ncbi:hypothetical protein GO495_08230 [Chitinophaga oryziterrae]|uniref:Uncharacterized protein n=1 Tax=Chitinophaga oryziterrae TaxID=1031224 RepID=A0A6N8J5R0_9BACT|nr:hypothetical protein [Chitinophaga oryziterrae]MVT40567.1 hypothetical protein [Chitinophaga oryziterrae]
MYYTITFLMLIMGQVGYVYAGNNLADSTIQQTIALPKKYLSQVSHKPRHVEAQVNNRADKTLKCFILQETCCWASEKTQDQSKAERNHHTAL